MGKMSSFRKQTEDALKFNNQLRSGAVLFQKLENGPKGLKAEISRLQAEYVKLIKSQSDVSKKGDWKATEADIKRVKSQIDRLNEALEITDKKQSKASKGKASTDSGSLLGSIAGKAAGLLGALGIGAGAGAILGEIKDVTAEFQKYNAVLTNTLGSQSRAAASMQLIQDFAAATPFSVSELTESFVKLANQGFVPTQNELRQLADLAASTGKPFDQLVEAILDAQSGEFERLKEFGIKASKAGDQVTFSFKGQQTTVKNTEAELRNYILSLGDLQGVAGSTAAISGTLTGQLSNLGDTVDSLYRAIGERLAPIFTTLITLASVAVSKVTELFKSAAENSTDALKTQTQAVEQLENALPPLITRYDQLKAKSKLTADEQKELKTVTNQLAQLVPSAAKGFDAYGNALDINKSKVLGFAAAQRELNAELNKEAIDAIRQEANNSVRRAQGTKAKIQSGKETRQVVGPGGAITVSTPINADRAKQLAEDTKKFANEAVASARKLAAAGGTIDGELRKFVEGSGDAFAGQILRVQDLNGQIEKKQVEQAQLLQKQQFDKRKVVLKELADLQNQVKEILNPSLPVPKAATPPPKKEKKAKVDNTARDIQREEEKQIEERKKLQEELQKLQTDYEKQRLETLEKTSDEYLNLKKKLDLAEIDAERQKLIKMGQQATGSAFYNKKLQRVEVKDNLAYKLPKATEDLFNAQRSAVTNETTRQAGRAAEDKFEADRTKARKEFTDAEAKYDREQANKREKLARQTQETELELRQALFDESEKLIRKAGESEMDYERRKNEALLKIRLDYYEKLLKLAEADPSQKDQILGLKETIQGLRRELKSATIGLNSGPMDLFDLLGIKFDAADAEKNDLLKAAVGDAVNTALSGANQILQGQLANDQAQIESIDRKLEAKKRETDIELELSRQGLGNRLGLKRQEESALQAERQKALERQRTTQSIQIGLNTLVQESELAVALAKIISNSATYGPLFPFIAGATIASMFAILGSGISQIASLPKFHDGDEVTWATVKARQANGTRKADEVDARLQIGEGVIQKSAYQSNKVVFKRLNTYDRALRTDDLEDLLAGTGVGLPESSRGDLLLIQRVNESRAVGPDTELHRRVDDLNAGMKALIQTTKNSKYPLVTELPDGRIRVEDERGNVRVYNRS